METSTKAIEQLEIKRNKLITAHNLNLLTLEEIDKKQKFSSFPEWIKFQSSCYKQEVSSEKHFRYSRYKRGTVVRVHFGVGIGDELSGTHFAIVLNKEDNPNSGKLTVIPLSSKKNPNYYSLGDKFWKKLLEKLKECVDELNALVLESKKYLDEHSKITNALENDLNLISTKIFNKSISELEKSENFNTNEDDKQLNPTDILNLIGEEKLLSYAESKKLFEDGYTEENVIASFLYHLSLMKLQTNEIIEKITKSLRECDKLEKSINFYKNKDKNSYLVLNNITTISKKRVNQPINEYDPLKNLRLDDEILDEIDTQIIRYLTQSD